jgi:hypothetical protein
MATRTTVGLELRPSQTDAQKMARLQAQHVRLLRAAAQLLKGMQPVADKTYAVDAGDVLALRYQVRESGKLYPVKHERTS